MMAPDDAAATTPRTPLFSQNLDFLPYGVPVPVNEVVTRMVEPYDPDRHGPPLRNTMPEANVAGTSMAATPPERDQRLARRSRREPFPGDGDAGWLVRNLAGIYAQNDAQLNVSLPQGPVDQFLYAPTHYPSKWSCIEVTTIHRRRTTESSTTHLLGWYDHCNFLGFPMMEVMDANWRFKYVRTSSLPPSNDPPEEIFLVQVRNTLNMPSGGCWEGLIFNWALGYWESKTNIICGSVQRAFTGGWSFWESYGVLPPDAVNCPSIPDIRATLVSKLETDGVWYFLRPTDVDGNIVPTSCFMSEYAFHDHRWAPGEEDPANYKTYWHAHTPSGPWQ